MEQAKRVYQPEIYEKAAQELIAEGLMSPQDFPDFRVETGFRPVTDAFIDALPFDGTKPNAYLQSLSIGLK